jgi:hypothetical protein
MRIKQLALLIISAMLFSSAPLAIADEVTVDRPTRVEEIKSRWNPLFDQQYLQLTALEARAKLDPNVYRNYKYLLDDFIHVRSVIDTALGSASGDIEAANAYAEEETGEFMMSIPELAKQVAKIKTIICIKGKSTKKVTSAKPVCPKGFKKK